MELAKCVARSQRKDAKNGLYGDVEGCGRAYGGMAAHSIVLCCGFDGGQMRGDRPMRVAKCGAAAQLSC